MDADCRAREEDPSNEGIGRTDLHQGNFEELKNSIQKKLYTLPNKTKVCPGHGKDTTIEHEKHYNPFVKPLS